MMVGVKSSFGPEFKVDPYPTGTVETVTLASSVPATPVGAVTEGTVRARLPRFVVGR